MNKLKVESNEIEENDQKNQPIDVILNNIRNKNSNLYNKNYDPRRNL